MANIFKSEFTGEFFEKDEFLFNEYPVVDYDIKKDGQTQAIRNYLKRFSFRESIRDTAASYSEWIVRDEDTPEIIAHKLYGSTHYYWLIMLLNLILDPLFGWPLTDRELYQFVEAKYGAAGIRAHHHWESDDPVEIKDLPAGIIVDERYHRKVSITNYAYEYNLNEAKRNIKLLKPEYLPDVLSEWQKIKESEFTEVV